MTASGSLGDLRGELHSKCSNYLQYCPEAGAFFDRPMKIALFGFMP